ncbi:Hypothetical predicted protein, partial [Marmota monax]
KIAEEEAKAMEEEGVPDEEDRVKVFPWIRVGRMQMLERGNQKRADQDLLNFSIWQHGKTKMEHPAQLLMKFKEDKQRMQLM